MLGGGRSSVEAWYTTALDIEEVLSGAADSDVHLLVADVLKSFDTMDRGILDSLRKLWTAIVGVVWSRRQSLANTGAVLSLLDGPSGCDPAFCVVWFRFRMLRRYLAYRPGEVFRIYRLLGHAADGCPGHGPTHLLTGSAAEIGFVWSADEVGWVREEVPVLSSLAGPIQHFRTAVLEGLEG